MKRLALKCTDCDLCMGRNRVVWASGPISSPVKLVGEGPGEEEDRTGIPFVGKTGTYMTGILIELTDNPNIRDLVYITNMVMCRPPGNRNPTAEEIKLCSRYLRYKLYTNKPKIVGCVGRVAADNLIGRNFQWGKLYRRNDLLFTAVYHPSYVLRQGRNSNAAHVFKSTMRAILTKGGLL